MSMQNAIKKIIKNEPHILDGDKKGVLIRRVWMYHDPDANPDTILRSYRKIKANLRTSKKSSKRS